MASICVNNENFERAIKYYTRALDDITRDINNDISTYININEVIINFLFFGSFGCYRYGNFKACFFFLLKKKNKIKTFYIDLFP